MRSDRADHCWGEVAPSDDCPPVAGPQPCGAAIELPPVRNVTLPTPGNLFKTVLKIVCNIQLGVSFSAIGQLGAPATLSLVHG